MSDTVPELVGGRYRILARLGKGAMGVVYTAHDPVLDRKVAIKQMMPEIAHNEELRQRFFVEARAAAKLNHPNIITVHELEATGHEIYIVMELLEGKSLGDLLKARTAPLPLNTVLDIMAQVCDGLNYAHDRAIIHRDIKPANLFLLSATGVVKILDFGIARLGSLHMTQVGAVLGTPDYMAPEQVRGDEIDRRTDLWAIGAVLYELLAGVRPFTAKPLAKLLMAITQTPHVPLQQRAPSLPAAVCDLVERLLSKPKDQRPANAGLVRDELRAILGRETSGSRWDLGEPEELSATLVLPGGTAPGADLPPAGPPSLPAAPAVAPPPPLPAPGAVAAPPRLDRTAAGTLPASPVPRAASPATVPATASAPPLPVPAPPVTPPAPPVLAPPPAPPVLAPPPTAPSVAAPSAAPVPATERPPQVPSTPPASAATPAVPVTPLAPATGGAKKGKPYALVASFVLALVVVGAAAGWWYLGRGQSSANTTSASTPGAVVAPDPQTATSDGWKPPVQPAEPTEEGPPLEVPPGSAATPAARADEPSQQPSRGEMAGAREAAQVPPDQKLEDARSVEVPSRRVTAPPTVTPPPEESPRVTLPPADARDAESRRPAARRETAPLTADTVDALTGRRGSGVSSGADDGANRVAAINRITYVLEQYGEALAQRDASGVRRYRPNVSAVETEWLNAKSLKVTLDEIVVDVNGTQAVARASRSVQGVADSGAAIREQRRVEFHLVRRPTGWVIVEIR